MWLSEDEEKGELVAESEGIQIKKEDLDRGGWTNSIQSRTVR